MTSNNPRDPGSGPRTREAPAFLLLGALSLLGATCVSLYPPFGTALFGPPVYPFALAAFLLVTICATALTGLHWQNLPTRPERWALPFAGAVGIGLIASPFPDRAAFPALGLLLLPASSIVITAWIAAGQERKTRCFDLFRITAFVAIGISVWGLISWAVVDFGARTGAADRIAQLTGLNAEYPTLFGFANQHPFGHKNFVAGFAILMLPILSALLCLDKSRLKLVWLGGLPIVFLYLVSAESRGGWLGLATGATFYIAVRTLRARRARPSWWLAPILLVVIAIPFLASPRLRESARRVSQEETLAAIDPYRWEMFQTGINVGNAHPLTGIGPGALSLVSPEHSASTQYPVVYQVHSTPIQLYAETGLVGIFGSLILAWGVFWSWKGRRGNRLGLEGHLKDAAAVALVSYAALSLTDYQLDVPAIVLELSVSVGAILGLDAGASGRALRKSWWAVAVVTAVVLLPILWFNGNGFLARRHLQQAMDQLGSGDVGGFTSAVEHAQDYAPTDPLYLNQLANVWMIEWRRADDPARRQWLAEQARLAWEQSLEIAPAQDSAHFNLGILLRFQNQPKAALMAFQAALDDNSKKRFAWFLMGQALAELGEDELAAEAFARELRNNPSSLFLPLWRTPAMQPHIEARNRHFLRLAATTPISPAQRYLFFWSIGEPQPFEGEINAQTDGFRVLLLALEGDPETAVAEAPLTPQALLVQAWLDSEEPERWLRAAFLQATGTDVGDADLEAIAESLKQTESFSEALRTLLHDPRLPMTTKLGKPRANGLFERNFYGAPLFDFFSYQEPLVLPLL